MDPDATTADAVREALRAIRAGRPLGDSPLLRMRVLGERLGAEHVADSPNARSGLLPRLLEEVTRDQLALQCGDSTTADRTTVTADGALRLVEADFQAHSLDREAWGILHFRFFSGSSVTLREVADLVGVSYQTVRRRVLRGTQLLADALTDMERGAATAATRGHSVPEPLTRFIGREQELADIRRLLASHRLITLTGPGGIGKSRLAVHLARDLAADFDDGVWFVELTALSDGGQVPQAAVDALGLSEQPGLPLTTTLIGHLTERRALLVLDNCEHVVQAASDLVGELLGQCPSLQVLATSREDLHVDGQALFAVPPMALPTERDAASVVAAVHVDAVRLFRNRASAAQSSFKVDSGNALQVTRICAALDGIPLAIELAAARLRFLALDQLEDRLDDRFQLLKDGRHASRPSHETLRATIDWSYELLSEEEQALLRRLSVFRGGWTLEAAEAVCSGEGIDEADVLELLTQLGAKSLVGMSHVADARRFTMLETVRQYAAERLSASGESDTTHGAHLRHFLAMAEAADPGRHGPRQKQRLSALEDEAGNLRDALEWAVAAGALEDAVRMGWALHAYWFMTGRLAEGRDAVSSILGVLPDDERSLSAASALRLAGDMARQQGHFEESQALYEESLALGRKLGDDSATAAAAQGLGLSTFFRGDPASASSLLEESLLLYREMGDEYGTAVCLGSLGLVCHSLRELASARAYYSASLDLSRKIGNARGITLALHNLANCAMEQGDYDASRRLNLECLAMRREQGDEGWIPASLCNLCVLAIRQGDLAEARAVNDEALERFRQTQDMYGTRVALSHRGEILIMQGDCAAARACLEEAVVLCREADDVSLLAEMLCQLGIAMLCRGDVAESRALVEEGRARAQQLGNPELLARTARVLGLLAWMHDDIESARQLKGVCLREASDSSVIPEIDACIEFAAWVAASEQHWARTARLIAVVEAHRSERGEMLAPWEGMHHAAVVENARRALGTSSYDAAHAEGRALMLDEAVAYALDEVTWDELAPVVAERLAADEGGDVPVDGEAEPDRPERAGAT